MNIDPSIKIETCSNVYPPSEDTYLLLSAIEAVPGQKVLEMGTGTGIIALHCAKAGCCVSAADVSPESVECARKNAERNDLDIEVIQSDLFENISEKFDVLIFNPPYLSSQGSEKLAGEVVLPLIGGEKGHEISARFLELAIEHLNPEGKIYLLTSSESEEWVLEAASNRYSVRKISEERIFFELLAVYELKWASLK